MLAPLLGLELLLRLAGPFLPGEYQTAAFSRASDVVGRTNQPNSAGWKRTAEFTTWVRVNAQGLRGPELSYAKPAGVYRILALGDSFTFALQVNEEQTFVARLSELLNAGADEARVEVINAGVDGWSTANQYAWFATEGYRYEPDLILLMFYVGNDPGENADQVGSTDEAQRLRLGADRSSGVQGLPDAVRQHSLVWNLFEQGVLAKLQPAEAEQTTDETFTGAVRQDLAREILGFEPELPLWSFDSRRKARGWQSSEVLLNRLAEFSTDRGADLIVVEIPTADQVVHPALTMSPLPAITARLGLPMVGLLQPFREQPKAQRERLYLSRNRHWTTTGHELAAQTIAAELRKRGLTPGARQAWQPDRGS